MSKSKIKFKYSRNAINDAGDSLAGRSNAIEADLAWEILDYWRAIHHTPLHTLYVNLSRHARRADKNALVARRLKRASSIFSKLKRENDLTLRKMQDIAGCRAIVSSLGEVLKLRDSLLRSSQLHVLERTKNYIDSPKASGYRGIHLIYKFQSNDLKNASLNGLRVEIQIRTMPQHLWATAVEIVGTLTKQALKSSQGSGEWLKFFKYVSEGIALVENKTELPSELKKNIFRLEKKLDVRKKLAAYSLALNNTKPNDANYYLLELDDMNLRIRQFNDVGTADSAYLEAERRLLNKVGADVVLVGAESFHKLKKAYPNYFGDSARFVKLLETLIKDVKQKSLFW